MATREFTICIPDELAETFSRRVPVLEQPQFIVEALRSGLRSRLTPEEKAEREARMIAAAETADYNPISDEEDDAWLAEMRARYPPSRG
jgi:hypothetical protein